MGTPYLKNLNRIEFVITYACTGKCKHCSEGDHPDCGEHIDGRAAARAVKEIAGQYMITSLMTFGGEPLLYPEDVCRIHTAAKEAGIGKRQLITNGYFSKEESRIAEVARMLAESGVNDVLLSVDAFHQETIPTEPVKVFVREGMAAGLPIRLSPAWLVDRGHENPYNQRTREVLAEFEEFGIPVSGGNVIFPSGNARKYLSEYFEQYGEPENPYADDPDDVRCVSFNPDGSSTITELIGRLKEREEGL
ncbi:MAG: radical SAM protein [Lachnospiraceae bacterium]|nr:radical SAM protein [Lachnospiraceae bacterium]